VSPSISRRLDTIPESSVLDEGWTPPSLTPSEEQHRQVSRNGARKRHATLPEDAVLAPELPDDQEPVQRHAKLAPSERGRAAAAARWGQRTPEQVAEQVRARRERIAALAPAGYLSVQDFRTARGLGENAVRRQIRLGQLAVLRVGGHVYIAASEAS